MILGIATGDLVYYGTPESQLVRDVQEIKYLGARWMRYDWFWPGVQGMNRDDWWWGNIDQTLDLARSNKLATLAVLHGTPRWANGNEDFFTPPSDPADLERFAYTAGLRYLPLGVRYWQIGNEVNLKQWWTPGANAADFVSMYLRPAVTGLRRAAKELGKTVQIVLSGLAPMTTGAGNVHPAEYLRGIYEAGAKSLFNLVALHPYVYGDPSGINGWGFQVVHDLREVMEEFGQPARPIWATESGWSTSAITEAEQAELIASLLLAWDEIPYRGPVFLYQHRDRSTSQDAFHDNFGLHRHDGARKLAFYMARGICHA